MTRWQRLHIFNELAHHNCNIEVFNPLKCFSTIEANEKLIKKCRNEHFDLFMTPYNEKEVFCDTVKQIKHFGIPTMLICFDNLIVPYVHGNIAPIFDLVWLTAQETERYFDRRNCNSIFLPYASNPFLKSDNVQEILGVGFIGTPYGSRINMINLLTQHNIKVYLHCMNPEEKIFKTNEKTPYKSLIYTAIQMMRFKEGRKVIVGAIKNKTIKKSTLDENAYLRKLFKIPIEDIYDAYRPYALALSSTTARNTGVLKKPIGIVNLRSFEIPMASGIQFCRYFAEINEYFEEDKEILFYRSDEEMIEKAKYYLAPERERVRNDIRVAARRRAEAEHTWFCRFSKIFNYLGLKC